MDIRSLNNDKKNYIDRTRQSDRNQNVSKSGAGSSTESGSSISDNLDISQKALVNELEFGKNVLETLRKQSFEKLGEIKRKIKDGSLDTDEVFANVSREIADDLTFLESLSLEATSKSDRPSTELTPELREKLTQNEEVLNQISDRLLDNLLNL